MKKKTLNALSNALAYHIQDLLDGISYGSKFSLKKQEKQIKKTIKAFIKGEK